MSLADLSQIKNGKELQKIIKSYDAKKVVTSVVKTPAHDEEKAVYYNADELITKLIGKSAGNAQLDKIAVDGEEAITEFTLTQKPDDRLVRAIINHFVYLENEDFTVDRKTKKVTWTATEKNNGFNIDNKVVDAVFFDYYYQDDNDNSDDKKGNTSTWSVDFETPGKVDVAMSLENILSEAQLNSLSNDNTGGVNWDGEGRTVQLYFLGNETKTLDTPYAMKWSDECSNADEEMKSTLSAAGFTPMVDAPYSCYNIDVDSNALNMVLSAHKYKMRLVKNG